MYFLSCLSSGFIRPGFQISVSEILNIQHKVWYKPQCLNLNNCGKTLMNMLVASIRLFSFPVLRQTEGHSVWQLPQMALWSFWCLYRGLPLPTGGADGGDGGAAECKEVRRKTNKLSGHVPSNFSKTADFYCKNEAITYCMFLLCFSCICLKSKSKYLVSDPQVDWKHETAQWVFVSDWTLVQYNTSRSQLWCIKYTKSGPEQTWTKSDRGVHILLATWCIYYGCAREEI